MANTSALFAPAARVRLLNEAEVQPKRRYVLYWMTSFRRTRYNFALQHALARAQELGLPLLVWEPLRAGYDHASVRHHTFVIEGMQDNARACAEAGVAYLPWVEPKPGAGAGLLKHLANDAALVVTDDWPGFFVPKMLASAAKQLSVRLEAVDSTGLMPLSLVPKAFARAMDFRRYLQKELTPHLREVPLPDPLKQASALPSLAVPELPRTWNSTTAVFLGARDRKALIEAIERLPVDRAVGAVSAHGGSVEGSRRVADFVRHRLPRYATERSEPMSDASSGLSPWIHFGHVSAHELLDLIGRQENWTPSKMSLKANGSKDGWWGMGASAEGFMDELVTWRELGHVYNWHHGERYDYDALPEWARATLDGCAKDERAHLYSYEQLEQARTHDPLWNAAQRQLLREGVIHNYLRMLWGKKVVEWTTSPRQALECMLRLNNRWAIDGRDPNSLSGIYWCLGRYDRPWAPKRPVFGSIRWMSSTNTAKKFDTKAYVQAYGATQPQAGLYD